MSEKLPSNDEKVEEQTLAPPFAAPQPTPEINNPIEEAKKILEETKKTLLQITEERKRIEKATAEMLINGQSYAGQTPPKPETEDEKWKREAKIRYAGTGMDPT